MPSTCRYNGMQCGVSCASGCSTPCDTGSEVVYTCETSKVYSVAADCTLDPTWYGMRL